jgi:hypothetical protein
MCFSVSKKDLEISSSEKVTDHIKDNINKREKKQKEINKKIKEENIIQERIKNKILEQTVEMEKKIEEIESLDEPTPNDFDKLFSSFRNRRN